MWKQAHRRRSDHGFSVSRAEEVGNYAVQTYYRAQSPRRGEWVVPDLKGLDMRQVMEVCGKMKCDATSRESATP